MLKLGVFYYSWYIGRWINRTPYADDLPILGEYNNVSNSVIVEEHAKMMARAGIDFAIISWGKSGGYEYVLEAMAKHGIKVCCLYESLIRAGTKKIKEDGLQKILRDMEVIKDYLDDPCWLRINDKPVVMLYVTRVFADSNKAISDIRNRLGDVYLVGDELFWGVVPSGKLKLFDAVTAYNMYEPKRFDPSNPCESFNKSVMDMMRIHVASCQESNVALWPNAMPGYDDSYYRPESKHPPIPRMDGEFFRKQLVMAKSLAKDGIITITSFNEHFEGSGIEALTSHSDKYLKMIKDTLKNE